MVGVFAVLNAVLQECHQSMTEPSQDGSHHQRDAENESTELIDLQGSFKDREDSRVHNTCKYPGCTQRRHINYNQNLISSSKNELVDKAKLFWSTFYAHYECQPLKPVYQQPTTCLLLRPDL